MSSIIGGGGGKSCALPNSPINAGGGGGGGGLANESEMKADKNQRTMPIQLAMRKVNQMKYRNNRISIPTVR